MNNSFVLALSTLVGTIVGAGIFGLPYVISKSGIMPGVFYFVILGGAVLLLHLFMGEIALRTAEKHRLIGYASLYLGDWGSMLATFSTLFGIVGAVLAYIIIGGEFFKIILSPILPFSDFGFSLLFWALLTPFILRGIQLIAKVEFFMNIALFAVIGLVFVFAFPHVNVQNFPSLQLNNIFLPFGVILFALTGWSAIPEIADLFKKRKEKRQLDNLIVWTFIIVTGLYILFSLFVIGVSGEQTSPDALSGLKPFLGKNIITLGALFGLLAIATSFLILGNYLKNSLRYDLKLSPVLSAAIAIFAPLALFLLGFRSFIEVIGLVGAGIGAFEGVLIILIFQKAKTRGDREPEYSLRVPQIVLIPLVAMLAAGALAEILLQ